MDKKDWDDYFKGLGDAISRLREALSHPEIDQEIIRDAVIQRFEFTLELYWKVLRNFVAYEGVITKSPRESLSKSYQYHIISNEKAWLLMLEDRNKTSHVYKQELAEEIFVRIKEEYIQVLEDTYKDLVERFKKIQ